MCKGHEQYPAFALVSSKVSAEFFWSLISLVQKLPQLCMHAVIFSPILFPHSLLLQERYTHVQALHHCSKGFKVPSCLDIRVYLGARLYDS